MNVQLLGNSCADYGTAQLLEDPGESHLLVSLVREPEIQLLEETCADICPVAWELLCGLRDCPVA